MKKKIIIFTLLILIIVSTFIIIYKNREPNLEKYDLSKQEFYEFNYKKNTYAISAIYDEHKDSSVGIFLSKNNNHYLIEKIDKCDYSANSFYVNENKIYLHCNFSPSNIIEYKLNGINFNKKTYKLNLKNSPNISNYHLQFDKVDDNYAYLYSVVKVDDSIVEGYRIKCSLTDNICNYDNGYISYSENIESSSKLIYEEVSPNKEYIKDNDTFYILRIYQNKNNVTVRISSNNDFKDIQYDIKSNKTISKDNIKIEWVSGNYLYEQKDDVITKVGISIFDNDVDYSLRIIDLLNKSVSIINNNIIK